MGADSIDEKKRKFLLATTATVAAAGAVAAAAPFVISMLPSARAEAAGRPITVKIGAMKPGDQLTVMWRGRPVWIIRRSPEALASLPKVDPLLRDPNSKEPQQPPYAQNEYRSRKPEFLVLVGICTHLGCSPTYRPDPKSISPNWLGGFFCSCHGSKFDLAGRVFKGVPAPINMEVPPYVYLNDDEILIGANKVPEKA